MTDGSEDTGMYRVRAAGVTWRETGGEIVILDVDSSVYFGLNASAAGLWELLVTGASRTGLVDALVSGGSVDQHRASADVDGLLSALEAYRLVERR